MIDRANELRRHARKIPHPQGETPGVMLRAADEIECLRAKIEAMERQEPVAWCATDETGTVVEALGMNQSRRFDTALYFAPAQKENDDVATD